MRQLISLDNDGVDRESQLLRSPICLNNGIGCCCQIDGESGQSPKPGGALALVNDSSSVLLRRNCTALIVSSSCSMAVALAIAPVIPGWAISHARATAAGVVWYCCEIISSAARILIPRWFKNFLMPSPRAL